MPERGSRLPLTLETAAAKLDGLAAGVVRRNLFDRQRTRSAIGERRERVDPVRDRLGRLYSFFCIDRRRQACKWRRSTRTVRDNA